jgi:diamine N-acetyltransferase
MKITIRKASAEDYATLCTLIEEVDSLHRNNLPRIFKKPDGPVRELDYFLGLISDENIGLFIAEAEGIIVGFVHAIVKDSPDIPIFVPRYFTVVDNIVVKPGFQNHGIGELLMDKMQEWSIAKGANSVELNVYEFNSSAISFYEECGYKTLSRRISKQLD